MWNVSSLQHFYLRSEFQNEIEFMAIGSAAASKISVQSRQFLVETKDSEWMTSDGTLSCYRNIMNVIDKLYWP